MRLRSIGVLLLGLILASFTAANAQERFGGLTGKVNRSKRCARSRRHCHCDEQKFRHRSHHHYRHRRHLHASWISIRVVTRRRRTEWVPEG